MGTFNSCGFGAISPELIIRSLLNSISGEPNCGIRVVDVDTSAMTMTNPFVCGSFEDVFTLFQRSLMLADDNQIAIRSTTTNSVNGANLEVCGNCGDGYGIPEILGSLFSMDENGNVYLNIINIT